MVEHPIDSAELTPANVCRYLLQALESAEGQTRRRKRDQAPDRLGLATKRDILSRAVAAAPAAAEFEGWLVGQIVEADAPGAARAMCEEIFLEYRMALLQPAMAHWLQHGAPSDDAEPSRTRKDWRKRDGAADGASGQDRWRGTDDTEFACSCHLPQR